jgi:hypothetical protein
MKLHEICIPYSGPFAYGVDDNADLYKITIANGELRKLFKIVHDYGGERLGIDFNNNIVISGAYDKIGVKAFNINTGDVIWERPDWKCVQAIKQAINNTFIISIQDKPTRLFDSKNGIELEKFHGCESMWQFDNLRIEERGKIYSIYNGKTKWKFKKNTFGILDCMSTKDKICISFSTGSTIIHDRSNPDYLKEIKFAKDSHVLKFILGPNYDAYGLLWNYQNGGDYRIIDLNSSKILCELNSDNKYYFIPNSDLAILDNGTILSIPYKK